MVKDIKTLVLLLGLTTAAFAQDVKLAYMKYFRGEIINNIYSYNYIESYHDQNYLSSLVAKDISYIFEEEPELEYGPIIEVIAQHGRETGWTREVGAGAYMQFLALENMYGELYFEPYWTSGKTKVIGVNLGVYPKENVSIMGSLEYYIEEKKEDNNVSAWLSIDVEL